MKINSLNTPLDFFTIVLVSSFSYPSRVKMYLLILYTFYSTISLLYCYLLLSSGLQDNSWFCDCKISKLIEISKMADTPVVLMDPFLTCSGPVNLAGVLFQRADLDNCVKPSVMTSATKITSPLSSNVLFRCDATGFPTPTLSWVKSDGSSINNTGIIHWL